VTAWRPLASASTVAAPSTAGSIVIVGVLMKAGNLPRATVLLSGDGIIYVPNEALNVVQSLDQRIVIDGVGFGMQREL